MNYIYVNYIKNIRVEATALLLREQHIGKNFLNLKKSSIFLNTLVVGLFIILYHFMIFIHTVFRMTQLRIYTNNANTYYYKNITIHCRSDILRVKKNTRTRKRYLSFHIRQWPFFYNKPKQWSTTSPPILTTRFIEWGVYDLIFLKSLCLLCYS